MLQTEQIVTFSEAAARLPKLNGRKVHSSSIWRWARKGLGGIRLETRRIGGRFVTSMEAMDRFAKALAEVELDDRPAPSATSAPKPRPPAQRERDIERAEGRLREAGVL